MSLPATQVQSIQEKIQERIKTTFMDLLPDEFFAKLVKEQVEQMIDQKTHWSAGEQTRESELQKLVKAEVKKKVAEAIARELEDKRYQPTWDGCGTKASEFAYDVVQKNINQIVAAMFGNLLDMATANSRNMLQSVINNRTF